MKTIDYADQIMRRYDLGTDYQLAKFMEMSMQTPRNWRRKGTTADDQTAIKMAALLEIDPAKVLADIHAERSKTPEEKSVWERIAKQFGQAAALALIVNLSLAFPEEAQADQGVTASSNSSIITIIRTMAYYH